MNKPIIFYYFGSNSQSTKFVGLYFLAFTTILWILVKAGLFRILRDLFISL